MFGPPRDPPECEAYAAMCIDAFGIPPLDRHDWLTRIDPANVRLARDGARVTGGLSLLPMGLWVGGRRVSMTVVHLVVVARDRRKEGIGPSLVAAALRELHAAGVALSVLYPATEGIYRHAGYEESGSCVRYRVSPERLAIHEDDGLIAETVPRAARASLHAVYRARAQTTAGNLDRSPWAWQRVLDPGGHAIDPVRVVDRAGKIDGYVVMQPAGPDVHLRDLVALTPAAERRLFTVLAATGARHIEWNGPPSVPDDPGVDPAVDRGVDRAIWSAVEKLREQCWFARVCDVPAALATRGYPPGVRATLHLDVVDDLLDANAGRWIVDVADGAAEIRRGGEGRIRVEIRGLAALITGHFTPAELVTRSLIEGAPADLAAATAVFAGPAPWMPDLF